jgi:hypothetical protein
MPATKHRAARQARQALVDDIQLRIDRQLSLLAFVRATAEVWADHADVGEARKAEGVFTLAQMIDGELSRVSDDVGKLYALFTGRETVQ